MNLPRTRAVLEQGMEVGLHVGAQLAVSIDGQSTELVLGLGRPEAAMTRDTLLPWFSMTKATTAVCVIQQWERGAFDLDDPVASIVQEFAASGKSGVTIRHLLTHTGGFRRADGVPPNGAFSRNLDESVAMICAAPLEDGWIPGLRAGYHPSSGMTILAEIVRRCDGRDFDVYAREEVFLPLDMADCSIGLTPDEQVRKADVLGLMHNTSGPEPRPLLGLNDPALLARVVPGGGGRGPMHQLIHLYECLLLRGQRHSARLMSPQTVEAMTARQRVGMYDETFEAIIDWGLGLHIDMILMGRHCSPRAVGHGGAQSSVAFCDPEHGLAVAAVVNGMAGMAHHRRFESVMTALYVDLGLAGEDDPGRDHNLPRVAA